MLFFILKFLTVKCSSHPLLRKPLSVTDKHDYGKSQPIELHRCGTLQSTHLQYHSCPEGSGNTVEGGQKDCKNQKIREFAVRFCSLIMSEAILIKSPQHHCPNISWTLMDMPTWTGKRLQDGKPTQRAIGNKECWDRRGVLPHSRPQNLVV